MIDAQVSGAAVPAVFRLNFARTPGVLERLMSRCLVRLGSLVSHLNFAHTPWCAAAFDAEVPGTAVPTRCLVASFDRSVVAE